MFIINRFVFMYVAIADSKLTVLTSLEYLFSSRHGGVNGIIHLEYRAIPIRRDDFPPSQTHYQMYIYNINECRL